MIKHLTMPIDNDKLKDLNVGDIVYLSGTIYTARDAAHKLMLEKKTSFSLKGTIIYYTGPTPKNNNNVVGSIGPTSSYRMDKYMEFIAKKGVVATIGKGNRSDEVLKICKDYKMVYFLATGGIGALLSTCVTSSEVVDFKNLDSEAIYKLTVFDFPLIVGFDSKGNSIFKEKEND